MTNIEIPFGAHDSELKGWEYTIPEGFIAEIKDGKVIVKEKVSEDERMRKMLIDRVRSAEELTDELREWILTYIEKHKEHSMSAKEVLTRAGLKPYKDGNQWCILAGDNIQEGICGFGDTIDDALYQFLMEVLEKQKEQKPSESSNEDVIQKAYKEGINDGITLVKKQPEDYGLQKPAEQDSEDVFDKIDNSFRKGREVGFREGVESVKPAE